MPRAWVMVLGDVGRSPRMQYHASSLCKTVSLRAVGHSHFQPAATVAPACCKLAVAQLDGRFHATLLGHLPPILQPSYEVTLIGYRGAALVEELQAPAADGRLTLAYLPDL